VGLSRSAWYRQPVHWTVRDEEVIAALALLVERRPSPGLLDVPEVVAAAGTAMEPQADLPGIQADEAAPAPPGEAAVAQRIRVPLYVPSCRIRYGRRIL
jgi:putative transposase